MKKRKKSSGSRVLEAMQIPPDLARKDCILTLCGNSELYIENYRRILEYQDEIVRILTRNGLLDVSGRDLEVASYSQDEMYITGRIEEITVRPDNS